MACVTPGDGGARRSARAAKRSRDSLPTKSPTEEPIRIVPFLRLIEIKSVAPASLLFLNRRAESAQNRRRGSRAEIREQTRNQNRGVPARSPQIRLFPFELPRDELAKRNTPIHGLAENPIAY